MFETSTSTINCLSLTGMLRMGVEMKLVWRVLNEVAAAGVEKNGTLEEVWALKGAATPQIKWRLKLANPRNLYSSFRDSGNGQRTMAEIWRNSFGDCPGQPHTRN